MPKWPQKVVKKGRQIETKKVMKKAWCTHRLEFPKRAARVRNHNKGETPRGPWQGGPRIVRAAVAAPEPFKERSKNHSIFWSNFEAVLVPRWLPKWVPKAPQHVTKVRTSQPKHEKDEFLKMSTSLTRDIHFFTVQGPKNTSKVNQKRCKSTLKNALIFA